MHYSALNVMQLKCNEIQKSYMLYYRFNFFQNIYKAINMHQWQDSSGVNGVGLISKGPVGVI